MNLGQLRTELQTLGYGTDVATQQTAFINAAYREIHSSKRWPFLEATDTTQSTVAGTASYTPPMANWRNIDAVRIADSLGYDPCIEYMEPQDLLERLHRDTDTNVPMYWTMYAQKLFLYPTPDKVYTVTYYYINEPADLSSDSDIPVIPIAYHDALIAGAVCRMTHRERDWIGLELWTTKYQQLVQALNDEYLLRQRQTSSHVQRSGYNNISPYRF